MNAAPNFRIGLNWPPLDGTRSLTAHPGFGTYGKHVGRVGALAVALGVGFAIASGGGAGVAHADTDSSSTDASSSDTGSESAPPSTDDSDNGDDSRSEPSDTSKDDEDTDDSEDDDAEAAAAADEAAENEDDADPDVPAAEDDEASKPPTKDSESSSARNEDDAPEHGDAADSDDIDIDEDIEEDVEDHVIVVSAAAEQTADDTASQATKPAEKAAEQDEDTTLVSADAPEDTARTTVTNLASARVVSLAAPADPVAPLQPTMFWAWLTMVTREIQRTWFNRRPDMQPEQKFSVSIDELGQASDPLAFGGVDPDGDPLKYCVAPKHWGGPRHGTVAIDQATGTFTYTPDDAFALTGGEDRFLVRVTDLSVGTRSYGLASWLTGAYRDYEFVTVVVAPVSQAPVASDDSFSGAEDSEVTGNVLTNDTDPDTDELKAQVVEGPEHGTVTLNADGSFVYTPHADFNGDDTFTYRATDDTESATATVTISISAANDAPTAPSASYGVDEDDAIEAALNGADRDGDPLTYTIQTPPQHGTVAVSSGRFTYTPVADYNGPDSFVYSVTDPSGESATGTISITVGPVNDPPVTGNDSYTVAEDGVLTIAAPGPLANDADDDDDPLTAAVSVHPQHGTVALNANGSFTYTPAADFHGADSFTYTVTDPFGATATATVSITVAPANDAPTVVGEPEVGEPQSGTGEVSGVVVATDKDDDELTFSTPQTTPKGGTVTIDPDSGEFLYTPTDEMRHDASSDEAAPGDLIDSFLVSIDDGNGGTATVLVTVDIAPANTPPEGSFTAEEPSGTSGVVTGTVTATDEDDDTPVLTAPLTSTKGGTIAFDPATGQFTYTPTGDLRDAAADPDATADDKTDTFAVTVDDGHGGVATVTVTVDIAPAGEHVNTPPEGSFTAEEPDTGTGVVTGTITATDEDGDTPVITVPLTTAKGGTVTFDPDTGEFTYTPTDEVRHTAAAEDAEPEDLVDSFVATIDDGNGGTATVTVTVDIAPDNTPPQGDSTAEAPTGSSGVVTGTVTATDEDGDTPVITVPLTSAKGGTIAFDPATGEFTYTPTDDLRDAAAEPDATAEDKSDTFAVTIDDQHGGITALVVTVDIAPTSSEPSGPPAGCPTNCANPTVSFTGGVAHFPQEVIGDDGEPIFGPDGEPVMEDGSRSTNNTARIPNVDYYSENGFIFDFVGGTGGEVGDYYDADNDVIHGHWGDGEMTSIEIRREDGGVFNFDYFTLTSNTLDGPRAATGQEKTYVQGFRNGVATGEKVLLAPEDWGFPAVSVLMGSEFDGVDKVVFTADLPAPGGMPVYFCFGMDSFYIST